MNHIIWFLKKRWLECCAIAAMWLGLSCVLDVVVTSALCTFLIVLAIASANDQG